MSIQRRLAAFSGAGLFAAALAWSLHQLVEYIVAGQVCRGAAAPAAIVTVIALLLLCLGAAVSLAALRTRSPAADPVIDPNRPRRFMAQVALMGAALFLFAIALQASAHLFLAPCAP